MKAPSQTGAESNESRFEAPDRLVIEDLERLKAISDPLRMRLLEELASRERSVTELASSMSTTRHRLYYHVRILEKLGLIVQTGSRLVSGTEERLYRSAARSFVISESISPSVLSGTVAGMFQQSLREVEVAMLGPKADDGPVVEVIRGTGDMTAEQHEHFVSRLKDLFVELEESDATGASSRRYSLLVSMAPVLDQSSESDTL